MFKVGQKFKNKNNVEVEVIDVWHDQITFKIGNEAKCITANSLRVMLDFNGYVEV